MSFFPSILFPFTDLGQAQVAHTNEFLPKSPQKQKKMLGSTASTRLKWDDLTVE